MACSQIRITFSTSTPLAWASSRMRTKVSLISESDGGSFRSIAAPKFYCWGLFGFCLPSEYFWVCGAALPDWPGSNGRARAFTLFSISMIRSTSSGVEGRSNLRKFSWFIVCASQNGKVYSCGGSDCFFCGLNRSKAPSEPGFHSGRRLIFSLMRVCTSGGSGKPCLRSKLVMHCSANSLFVRGLWKLRKCSLRKNPKMPR